jgi:hypothetical protein
MMIDSDRTGRKEHLGTWKVLLAFGLVLSLHGLVPAASITLYPAADSYVKSSEPDQNYGANTGFTSGNLSGTIYRTYIKFDLSAVPAGRKIVSARVRLDASFVSIPAPELGAHYLQDDSWDEGTITWNNAPTGFDANASDTVTVGIDVDYWTVTDDVFEAYRNDGVFSVVIKSSNESSATAASFWSREFIVPDARPRLEVEYIVEYSGGSGTTQYPYLIATAEDMNAIGTHPEDWDANFLQTADLNLSQYGPADFNLIGTLSEPFTGVFDGDGHSISGFTYESNGVHAIGLFRRISGADAAIKDLGLIAADVNGGVAMGIGSLVGNVQEATIGGCYCVDCNVSGGDLVGGLIGMNVSGTVSECYATGQVEGDDTAGGLSGFNGGQIFKCHASASVLSTESLGAGGLIGFQNANGTTWQCYATGAVRSLVGSAGGFVGGDYGMTWDCYASGDVEGVEAVGGFAGASLFDNSITGCCATGSTTGTLFVGGLVGYGASAQLADSYAAGSVTGEAGVGGLLGISLTVTVSDCYAVGAVNALDAAGGLVGFNSESTVEHCYAAGTVTADGNVGCITGFDDEYWGPVNYVGCFWDTNSNPDVNGIGNRSEPNVVGKTTAQMQARSTFTDAGWDFIGETVNGPNDIWDICEGTNYPRFVWQIPTADFVCPDGVDFVDYSFLAERWGQEDCGSSNGCDGADLDLSNVVDWGDIKLLCARWLEGIGQ